MGGIENASIYNRHTRKMHEWTRCPSLESPSLSLEMTAFHLIAVSAWMMVDNMKMCKPISFAWPTAPVC
jgi:hypothetical protein